MEFSIIPVVIPHYRKAHQLDKCIKHLRCQTVPVEIFIRDNNIDNILFTAAVNEGIRKCLDTDFEYLIILNQDMYLEPDAIEKMVRFMNFRPKCGISVPIQLYTENPNYVVWGGSLEAFPLGKAMHGPVTDFKENKQVYWANGTCMMLRKKMIQEIGLMDENFLFIGSDSDYSFTARARGWEIWCIADAKGVHEHGESGKGTNKEIELIKINDVLYFAAKWLNGDLFRALAFEKDEMDMEKVIQTVKELNLAKQLVLNDSA